MPDQNTTRNAIALQIANGLLPEQGPRMLYRDINFSVSNPAVFDLVVAEQEGRLDFIQTIFVDNSLNPYPFSINCINSNQTLTVAPNTQGYYPFLVPQQPHFSASTNSNYTGKVYIDFLNVAIPCTVWNAQNQAVIITPSSSGGGSSVYGAQGLYTGGAGNALLSNAATNIKTSAASYFGMRSNKNANNTDCFLLLYNALAANVVVGTTAPLMTVPIPGGGYFEEKVTNGTAFSTAMSAALVMTSAVGNAAPTTSFGIDVLYN